jgi:hypothetical protein
MFSSGGGNVQNSIWNLVFSQVNWDGKGYSGGIDACAQQIFVGKMVITAREK